MSRQLQLALDLAHKTQQYYLYNCSTEHTSIHNTNHSNQHVTDLVIMAKTECRKRSKKHLLKTCFLIYNKIHHQLYYILTFMLKGVIL